MELPPPQPVQAIPTNCHDTALCLVPPQNLWPSIERLRCQYDAAYDKWPPHVNLVYPFVSTHDLSEAIGRIIARLGDETLSRNLKTLDIRLNSVSFFNHGHSNTLYLHPGDTERASAPAHFRSSILQSLGVHDRDSYVMHMSIGQSVDSGSDLHKFLMEKLTLLPSVQWMAGHLVILCRDRRHDGTSMMRFWGAIDLQRMELIQDASIVGLYEDRTCVREIKNEEQVVNQAYTYSSVDRLWKPTASPGPIPAAEVPETLAIASYNVLGEFTHPPTQARYPLLVDNLLSTAATADILVLQEVTDDFLIYLLAKDKLLDQYPFTTHGPPNQPDLDPLPSFLNLVVLSKFPFTWNLLPLKRQHKASLIVTFSNVGKQEAGGFHPLVLAACHLSRGLTDGAVLAKKGELQRTIGYLQHKYKNNPWIVAGDFNLATSQHTINSAREKGSISHHTVGQIHSVDEMLWNSGLHDAWVLARRGVGESSDDLRLPKDSWQMYEGEQGATFDPTENELAAKLTGVGLGNRPQRYDRILVKADNIFHVAGFNMFGFPTVEDSHGGNTFVHGSDHWGVRCLLGATVSRDCMDSTPRPVPVALEAAPVTLGGAEELKEYLVTIGGYPTVDDEAARTRAFESLEAIILDAFHLRNTDEDQRDMRSPALVLTTVGSFGLGVWSGDSDIDCLCIGPFSSRTFFSVTTRRLRVSKGIKVLRRVKANTGVMLELEADGVRIDLQYCGASSIAERWPTVIKRPASDPIWALPSLTLLKLKPARDISYLRRSIPDLVQFRLAYLLIKSWAKEKGIYAAKFGYLGGIHLSAMLVPICKMLSLKAGRISVADVIVTFFHHYARFDWKGDMVFDPFFHKRLRYVRTAREPLCLIGWHGPSLNTALAASLPTVKTIASQFRLASDHLGRDGVTWSTLLSTLDHQSPGEKHTPGHAGAAVFLRSFRSYVRLDANYWGLSLERRDAFVGWLGSRCVSVLVGKWYTTQFWVMYMQPSSWLNFFEIWGGYAETIVADIDRKIPGLITRIWPARFVEATNSAASDEANLEYRGCFLIGLEWSEDKRDAQTRFSTDAAEGTLIGVLRQFEDRIRSDEKYYDPITSWMAATIVRRKEVSDLKLDSNEWGGIATLGDDNDSDLEEGDDPEIEEEYPTTIREMSTIREKRNRPTKQPGAGKLRPAADVMNRLRWDDSLDSCDYLVGYEDRFAGVKEKDLMDWKTEQTDEEFIPQHRIAYFKRQSDGVVVWDRVKRFDMVFGSG